MGTYGLIREAVYIPSVPETYDRNQFLKKQFDIINSDQKNDSSIDEPISVFDDPSVKSFAVKTLKKSQKNVEGKILPNEILNLIKI
jgi:hypothetical protein